MLVEPLEGRRLLAVAGTVTVDFNGNGAAEPGEPGLAGVVVYLDGDRDGRLDDNEAFAQTQSDGTYRIESPPVGRFELRQQRLDGYVATGFGATVIVQADGRDQPDVNLTAAPLTSISGTVYHDENRNGGKSGATPDRLDRLWTGAVVVLGQPDDSQTESNPVVGTVVNAYGEIVEPSITVSGRYEFNNLLPAGVTLRTPDGEITGPERYIVSVQADTGLQTFPIRDQFGEPAGIATELFDSELRDAGPFTSADFNGDGRLDLAVGTTSSSERIDRIQIFYNFPMSELSGADDGNSFQNQGTLNVKFVEGPSVAVPGIAPDMTSILARDFDNDGLMDLVIASIGATIRGEDDYVAILPGRFDPEREFDRFGDPIVLANATGNLLDIESFPNIRQAFADDLFLPNLSASRTISPIELAIGTLGRQSTPYVVSISQGSNNISLMHPIYAGAEWHLPAGGTDVRALIVDDLNLDGFDDIVVGSFNGNVRVYQSNVLQTDDPATPTDELVVDYIRSDRNVGGNVVDMVVVDHESGDTPTVVIATVAERFGTNQENLQLYSVEDESFVRTGGLRTSLVPSSLEVWNASSGVVQSLVVADRTTDRVQVFSVTDEGYVENLAVSTRPALTQPEPDDSESNNPIPNDEESRITLPPPFRDHEIQLLDLNGDLLPELISVRGAAESTQNADGEDRDLPDKDLDGVVDEMADDTREDREHPGGFFVLSSLPGSFSLVPTLGIPDIHGGDFGLTFTEPIRLVSGRVFNDLNADGANVGERGLSGVTVSAVNNRTGQRYEQVVAEDGVYQIPIAELSTTNPESVTVTVIRPNGFRGTTPLTQVFQIQPGMNGPDFGLTEAQNDLRDYGDAPNSYLTLIASGGPSHGVSDDLFLGSTVDSEPSPRVSATATGDDRLGQNDDDGVRITTALIAGLDGEIIVDVTNMTGRNGYLRGWIDFNADGDFLDPGELIVGDRVIRGDADGQSDTPGQGSTSIVVAVPNNLSFPRNGILETFARFRYSDTPGAEIGGHKSKGEVEDYAFRIFASEDAARLAFNDRYVVSRNAIDSPLSVLDNDQTSIANPLNIDPENLSATLGNLTTTATPAGTQVLLYTPPPGYIGPVTLRYGVTDRSGRLDYAEVHVEVADRIGTVTTVDDTMLIPLPDQCDPSRFRCEIDVLANDSFDGSRPLRIRSVGDGSAGGRLVLTPEHTLVYQPVDGFVGVEQFTYTAESQPDESSDPTQNAYASGTVTMVVGSPSSMNSMASIDVRAISATTENVITSVNVGDVFRVRVSVDDLRNLNSDQVQGVASAFLDLLYPGDLVNPVDFDRTDSVPLSIQFGERFAVAQNQLESLSALAGVLDEFGGAIPDPTLLLNELDLESLSHEGPADLFTITMRAIRPGTAIFQADPADGTVPGQAFASVTLLDGVIDSGRLPLGVSQIRLGETRLRINQPLLAGVASLSGLTAVSSAAEDVNLDNRVTALDALIVINELNRLNAISSASGEFGNTDFDSSVDVNGDGFISAIDALQVINFLNSNVDSAGPIESEPIPASWQLADDDEDDMLHADWLEVLAEDQRRLAI
ncbi:dockerin type I domain-containing protein [Neorhodopirellula pilleata]|uniref:FG-GAP repeat protein n=1 Tax=Neorhodopirellula pilleata TaxID=2714738 RepID=A0A5C6AUF9_9BACT|nr:dockerin type I domain-containing protein [Neorhodopirellula pilleata]TWU03643.1 FG-GAP repeat protein [Neorhodopirellula pilleata]